MPTEEEIKEIYAPPKAKLFDDDKDLQGVSPSWLPEAVLLSNIFMTAAYSTMLSGNWKTAAVSASIVGVTRGALATYGKYAQKYASTRDNKEGRGKRP